MRGWDPWGHIAQTNLELLWSALPYVAGAYVPDHRLVILHPGHSEISQRSALAEELAHHELGHRPSTNPIETARQETRARRWAASRLISAGEVIEAAAWTPYLDEIAELLEVEPDLVTALVDQMKDGELQQLDKNLSMHCN